MTLRLPFVKYFLKKENNYVFPSKQVEMRNMIDSISRNTDTNIDSIFYSQIEEFYQSVTNTKLVKEKYRGFLENNNDDIFVFIDISEELFDLNDDYEYLIIDEILNTKMVKNIDIDINIVELFKKYVFLQRLKTVEGIKVQFPKIGYICKSKTDGGYENILKQNEESVLLLYPKVEFENSNRFYLFSSVPLSVENMNLLFRFACFIENFDGQENMDNQILEENEIRYYMLKNTDLFTVLN